MIKIINPISNLKIYRYIFGIGLLLTLAPSALFALDPNRTINQFYHTSWTAKDGAPSQVSALAQTTDGYLWIGSALGLFRFDGVRFEQYAPPDQKKLPSFNIYALMATPDGGLWISFRPSGLGFLKDGQLKVFTRPEELPTSQVYCFAQTRDGNVWAGTHDGLALFNGTGWIMIGADWNFQPNRVRTLFVDRGGTLWVSKDDSIDFLPPGSKVFQKFEKRYNYINQIAQARNGSLWGTENIGPYNLINIATANLKTEKPEIKASAKELLFDRDGGLWLANVADGLLRIPSPESLGTKKVEDEKVQTYQENDGLSSNIVSNLLEDREGNIWVGTAKGLDRFRYSSIAPITFLPEYQKITLLPADNGEIYVGSTYWKPIIRVGKNNFKTISDSPVFGVSASSVYRDEKDSIWWGNYGGILHQQNEKLKFFPKAEEMKDDWIWEVIRGDGDGGVWVNYGDEGLIYFKDGNWERRAPLEGLPNRGPSASFHDEHGRIWLGYTENRVFVIDNNQIKGYASQNGIEIGRAKVIRGRGEELWIGGELGLAFLQGDKFRTVKTEGSQFGAISGIILTKNGDVWLNEIRGIVNIPADEISRLTKNPDYPVHYRLYDFLDNLPGGPQMNYTVSTAVEDSEGKLWFATDAGLAQIDPASMNKNTVPPPVIIKSIAADDKTYQTFSSLDFPAGTENLTIDYTALSLSVPERVQFKYRLDGLEDHWREAGNRREAFYTNLGPGKYRFQVIAANNDGVWNEQGATLEFEILPKFNQTYWFLFLCFAALAGFAWLAYRWRVYAVESRLNMQFEERLAERTRIAQDLHDTLLQGIVGVSMQIDVAVDRLPEDLSAKSGFDRIRELMTQIIEEGRNTVNGLRMTRGRSPNLEEELSRISQQFNTHGRINFRIMVDGTPVSLSPAIYDEIFHICREAIANAVRHSVATVIEINLEYTDRYLRILISDDGIGIDPNIIETGRAGHWGLSGMKERSDAIGTKMKISSRAGAGTEVELIVPNSVALERDVFGKLRFRPKNIFSKKQHRDIETN